MGRYASNRCAKKSVTYCANCQEPDEEMMTSFFWWRLPVEVETSR